MERYGYERPDWDRWTSERRYREHDPRDREHADEYAAYGSGFGYGSRGERGWDRDRADWETRRTGGLVEREDRGPLRWMGEKIAETVRGRGRGPKGYRRSDDRITDDVCERIARSGVDAEDVEVKVEGGEVTLSGRVRSRAEKRMLEDLADDVFGVEEVHNHLRLERYESST